MKFSSGIVPGSKTRRVMIKCPQTGQAVQTGVALDDEAFETVKLDYSFQCPACDRTHRWTKSDASLEAT